MTGILEQPMRKYAFAIICCMSCLACKHIEQYRIERGEEEIIARLLKSHANKGAYTVIDPDTSLGMTVSKDPKELESSKAYIKKNLKIPGYDPSKLIDGLFAYNAKSTRLTLKSSPDDGYVVDYYSKYANYFKDNGGGWEKLRAENPNAMGNTTVSIPAIDRVNNIILIYIGTQQDWLAGSGFIVAYKQENGALKEVGSVMLWIS